MESFVDGGDVDDWDKQKVFKGLLLISHFSLNTIIPVFVHTQRVLQQCYRAKWNEMLATEGKHEGKRGVAYCKTLTPDLNAEPELKSENNQVG